MINKLKNKTIWFNLLIVQVLSHIIFKVTFLNNINEHFQISSSLFSNNLELDQFFLESPTYLLIANILNINSLKFMIFKTLKELVFIKKFSSQKPHQKFGLLQKRHYLRELIRLILIEILYLIVLNIN